MLSSRFSRRVISAGGSSLFCAALVYTAVLLPATVGASGIFTDGAGARSQGLGGAAVAGRGDALEALSANPAALSMVRRPQLEVSGSAGWLDAEFRNRANNDAHLHEFGVLPAGALGATFGPLSIGLGAITDAGLRADWRYRDTPGGLGGTTTYGEQTQSSELILLRFALGASYALTPQLSIGASAGLLYNRNRLQAPYIIQTQPQLAGAKTLLDMETDGWGWNAQFGVLWRPLENLRLGVSYTLPSRLRTEGRASSDAGVQLANLGVRGVDATTDFDAEVTNNFPQIVSAGFAWRVVPRLEVTAQVDWINWAGAFDTLEVRLRNTDSQLYRALLAGSDDLDDDVPLDWRDQWVFRGGLEYQLTDEIAVRAGYRYARNPVPSETLTPLTAAISEHIVTAGIGYRRGGWSVDLAYQYALPTTVRVGTSRLLAGEYSDSSVEVAFQWLTLTVGAEF